jgi:hypothetical protein
MPNPPKTEIGGGTEARAESEERPPIGQADEDKGPRGLDVPTPKEGERYEAMNAVPAKAASVGEGAAQPAKISKPEFRR